ncbi:protein TsetseEP-like [Archocentrus centrarchus]|uniref:protein TsetseEP-like n=1 Tax=Archocentrus centrarchus TaxID=63155 RepID=UPI0011E9C0A6|nr:protein TsetseEP-like [Archocentrus centrarchus]
MSSANGCEPQMEPEERERMAAETYKKGHKAVLSPGSVPGPITSIEWKHDADIAVVWYGQERLSTGLQGRCEVNTNTGALTITNLSVKDSGSYTAEINNKIMKTTKIKVITPVPKPTIKKQCNSEVTQCTLTCDTSITADMGTITYSWKAGDRQIQAESPSNQLNITKNNTEFVGKMISCQLENPVSSERSDDIMSPFTNESSVGGTAAAVVIVLLIVASPIVLVCVHKRRSGNADQTPSSESQPVRNQDQPEPEPTGTSNGAAAIPENQEDPNQHQPEPEPTDTNNGAEMPNSTSEHQNEAGPDQTPAESTDPSSEAATSSESQTVKNQDQPEPEPRGTTTETATIPENQEDPNQHQPEPEPTDTNNGAEKPKSTLKIENETRSDQTPAESTDPSSEAETSAEAPDAEEPPDHHHQQEDETTEE